jgi:hypothetical protein
MANQDSRLGPRGVPRRTKIVHDMPPQRHVIPAPRARWILLHYRALSDPGYVVDCVLERSFGSKLAKLNGPSMHASLKAADVASFLAEQPEISAISGHLRYPKPAIPGVIVFDLCFFEDPLLRLWSMYNRLRRMGTWDVLGFGSKPLDARSFFTELLGNRPELVNDVQVHLLAAREEYTRPPTEADFRAAVDSLPRISVLGVMNLFEESALAAEHFLQPTFPALQFHHAEQHADTAAGSLQQQKDEFRGEVGSTIYLALER